MKLPFSKYEIAETRKALAGGGAAALTALGTALTNGYQPADLAAVAGAFIVGVLAVFHVKNRDIVKAAAVADALDPKLTPLTAPVADAAKAADAPATGEFGAFQVGSAVTILLAVALVLLICTLLGHPVHIG